MKKKDNYWNQIYQNKIKGKTNKFMQLTDSQLAGVLARRWRKMRVLDIGCGEGELLAKLGLQGFNTLGIDVSSVAVEKARWKQPLVVTNDRVDLINDDFIKYYFKDQKFDIIFCNFAVAFMSDWDKFFDKVKGLMVDNGVFCLLTPVAKKPDDDIFMPWDVLDKNLKKFEILNEEIIHKEKGKKLSLFVLGK